MEALVELIIQNAKSRAKSASPRQIFFQEFDRALQAAQRGAQPGWDRLENSGRAAGLSAADWAQRKNTLLWTLAQAA